MATTIATLAAKLVLDNRAFLAGFKQSIGASKGFATAIGVGMSSAMTSIAGAVASVATLSTAIHEVGESMSRIDRQAKLADRLGLTNEAMQRMAVIAKSGNVDVEVLAKAMLTMGRNIGSGGKSLDERFFDVADAIAAIKDPAERSAKRIEIFGKAGDELSSILGSGSARLRASADLIERFGAAMSDLDASKVERANDAWTRIGISLELITDKISTKLAPVFEGAAAGMMVQLDFLNAKFKQLLATVQGVSAALESMPKLSGLGIDGPFEMGVLAGVRSLFGIKGGSKGTTQSPGSTSFDLGELDKKKRKEAVSPGAFERNSIEAVRAVQKAGGDPISALHTEMQKAVRALIHIEGHVDPVKREMALVIARAAI